MALKDAVATIVNRNAFYRDGYRLLLRLSLIQTVVVGLLVAIIIGMALTTQTKQIYFATTSDGRIIPLVPLADSYRSNAEIVTWAARTTQDVMRFAYFDYKVRLEDAAAHFTTYGYTNFNQALKDSDILTAIGARKLSVTLAINAAPEIVAAGVVNGVYTWDVQFPITIKFDGPEPPLPINAMLKLRIVRVSTLQSAEGVGISQWVVQEVQRRR